MSVLLGQNSPHICWFKFLKCRDSLLSSDLHNFHLNILQAIQMHHLGIWEIAMTFFIILQCSKDLMINENNQLQQLYTHSSIHVTIHAALQVVSALSWPTKTPSLSLCFGMAAILMSWPSPANDGPALVSLQSQVENIVHFTVWAGHYWIILISPFVDFSISRPGVLYTQTSQDVYYYAFWVSEQKLDV